MKILLEATDARLTREPRVIGPGALVPPGRVILTTPKGTLLALGREEFESFCPEAVLDAASGRYSVPEFPRFVGAHIQEVDHEPAEPAETPQAALEPDVSAFHQGAGWYEIDGQRIRGKKAAQAALDEEAR